MAGEQIEGKSFFVALFLIFSHICNCSGTLVGFSYDATQENLEAWSPKETLAFVQKNSISSQFRVFLSKPEAYLDSLSNTQIPINFFLNPIEPKSLISWLETHTIKHLPSLNINTIVVNTTKHDFTSLLHVFNTIHSVLEKFDLDEKIEVSFRFSLGDLEKNLASMMRLVNKTNSSIFIETFVGRDRNLGDGFVHSILERALYICSFLLPYPEIPSSLNVKSSIVPSGAEMAEFTEKLEKSIDNHPEVKNRISALFIDITSISKAKFLDEKTTMTHDIFPSMTHDIFPPITVPITEPPPGTVTIPSNNPAIFPTNSPITNPTTNPTTTSVPYPYPNPTIPPPITYPYTNPTIPPFTSPATNPTIPPQLTNPTTSPVTYPVTNPTNPVTTPITNPVNQPVTNPVTTYPFPPPTGTVPVTPAAGVPTGTVPVTPVAGSGQTWCVARSDVPQNALQNALDYACGIGGVDCSAIQVTGGCYNPNSLQAHASYAFNSYYQRNPVPTSCDFGGTATLVTTNPSSGTCNFPSSSSSGSSLNPGLNPGINPGQTPGMNPGLNPGMNPGLNPVSNPTYGSSTGSTGIGTAPSGVNPTFGSSSGSGSSVLNTNSSDGSNTVFGSDNPTGSFNRSSSVHPGVWILFAIVFTMLKLNL